MCTSCKDHPELFANTLVKALKPSTRRKLTEQLDEKRIATTQDGLLRDWRGLAELAEYSNDCITKFDQFNSPTEKFLDTWQNEEGSTIEKLLCFLETLGRYDIIEDLTEYFYRDSVSCLNNSPKLKLQIPVQDAEVTSVSSSASSYFQNDEAVTVQDTLSGVRNTYDAYVCYAKDDEDFVHELIKQVEDARDLCLCIPERDLLAGVLEHSANINLIRNRCRRMIIVISPSFLDSPEHSFLTMLAQAISVDDRKRLIIPVIYKSCMLPPTLHALSKLDFTRGDMFNCFWERLACSLRQEGQPTLSGFSSSASIPSMLQVTPPSPVSGIRFDNRSPTASLGSPSSGYISGLVTFENKNSVSHSHYAAASNKRTDVPLQEFSVYSDSNIIARSSSANSLALSPTEKSSRSATKKSNSALEKVSPKPLFRKFMKKKHSK